MVNESINQFLN